MNLKYKLQQLVAQTKKNSVNGLKFLYKKTPEMSLPENGSSGNCHKKKWEEE